jgi:hypothetical protein
MRPVPNYILPAELLLLACFECFILEVVGLLIPKEIPADITALFLGGNP